MYATSKCWRTDYRLNPPSPRQNLQAHLDWWCRIALSWWGAMGMRCRWRAVRASCLFKETRPPPARRFERRNSLKRHQDSLLVPTGDRNASDGSLQRTHVVWSTMSLFMKDFILATLTNCYSPPFSWTTLQCALSASEAERLTHRFI